MILKKFFCKAPADDVQKSITDKNKLFYLVFINYKIYTKINFYLYFMIKIKLIFTIKNGILINLWANICFHIIFNR